MAKIDQNLVMWSEDGGHQFCQDEWKMKLEKLFGSYRVNKSLWTAAATYEPVEEHISHPRYTLVT